MKMRAIFWLKLLLLYSCASAVRGLCASDMPCVCNRLSIVCRCLSSYKNGSLDLAPVNITFKPQTIQISNCDSVRMHPAALSHFQLYKLEIASVNDLQIVGSSFLDMNDVTMITIRDVIVDTIPEYAFVSLRNIGKMEFVNVTIETISTRSFYALSYVTNVTFVNCFIKTIESNAFNHSDHVTSFQIRNSVIHTLNSDAIELQNAQNVVFENVTVENWKKNGVILRNVSSIHVFNSSISFVYSEAIFASNLQRFYFRNNQIARLGAQTFIGLNGLESFGFENNFIEAAERGAFELNGGLVNCISHVSKNVFLCSEDMCWLLDSSASVLHRKILETSMCRNPVEPNVTNGAEIALEVGMSDITSMLPSGLKEIPITTIVSMMDDEDICADLESSGKKSLNSLPNPPKGGKVAPNSTKPIKPKRKTVASSKSASVRRNSIINFLILFLILNIVR